MSLPPQMSLQAARFLHRYTPEDVPGKWRITRFLNQAASRARLVERAVVRTRHGFRVEVATDDFIQRQIYLLHEWEPQLCRVMAKVLRPGGVFLDIGANIGYLSLYGAELVGPRGHVFSFEPNPACRECLIANVELNGYRNVTVLADCVGDRKDRILFYPNAGGNSGAGSIIDKPHSGEPIDVAMDTLDAIMRREAIGKVTLVKIDVEGAEVAVLRGAQELLSRPDAPPIVCEISEWSLAQLGHTKDDLFAILASSGYASKAITKPSISVHSSDDATCYQFDAFFQKREQL